MCGRNFGQTSPVVLNHFRVVAHLEEPPIVAHFKRSHIFVAHFDYVCDMMMTKLLGSASELMAAGVISKKAKKKCDCFSCAEDGQSASRIGIDLQTKISLLCFQFMGSGPYGCSYQPHLTCKPIIKVHKHLWPTRITCCGPPVENQWTSHRK